MSLRRFISFWIIVSFFLTTLGPLPKAHADTILGLPTPGTMVNLTSAYMPVIVKGLRVHPENPILFDFIVDTGNSGLSAGDPRLKTESEKLIKYFLASLTIPEDDLWVNLSPYEKNRIIPDQLGQTEMGRDMLAEDYILKQLTASLIYPEKDLGKEFWNRVYTKARQLYGTNEVPVNTFNKVWIVADRAKVYVHDNTAFVVASHLKVMLEDDYLALSKHQRQPGDMFPAKRGTCPQAGCQANEPLNVKAPQGNNQPTSNLASQIIRAIILPELEKEINTGKNFANLRQIFHSMILAAWYKKNLKTALLNQVYSNKAKINGIERPGLFANRFNPVIPAGSTVIPAKAGIQNQDLSPDQIYTQYLKAYKKGVFNYIKEDIQNGQTVPRKYFSGGVLGKFDLAQTADPTVLRDQEAQFTGRAVLETVETLKATPKIIQASPNAAMTADSLNKIYRKLKGDAIPLSVRVKAASEMYNFLEEKGLSVQQMFDIGSALYEIHEDAVTYSFGHLEGQNYSVANQDLVQEIWDVWKEYGVKKGIKFQVHLVSSGILKKYFVWYSLASSPSGQNSFKIWHSQFKTACQDLIMMLLLKHSKVNEAIQKAFNDKYPVRTQFGYVLANNETLIKAITSEQAGTLLAGLISQWPDIFEYKRIQITRDPIQLKLENDPSKAFLGADEFKRKSIHKAIENLLEQAQKLSKAINPAMTAADISTGLKTIKEKLLGLSSSAELKPIVHLIIGNESGDLDSTVGPVSLALAKSRTSGEQNILYVPVYNRPRHEFKWGTHTAAFLKEFGVTEEDIVFNDTFDVRSLIDQGFKVQITLVDHNQPTGPYKDYLSKVVEVIDHHPYGDHKYGDGVRKEIENDGKVPTIASAITLIAQHLDTMGLLDNSKDLCRLLLGPIVFDTGALDPKGRATPRDRDMAEKLEKISGTKGLDLFNKLKAIEADVSTLTVSDLLRRDGKTVSLSSLTYRRIGIGGLTLDKIITKAEAEGGNLLEELKQYAETNDFKVLIGFINYIHPQDGFSRQMFIFSQDQSLVERLGTALSNDQGRETPFRLSPLSSSLSGDQRFRAYSTSNKADQKNVDPYIKAVLDAAMTVSADASGEVEKDRALLAEASRRLIEQVEAKYEQAGANRNDEILEPIIATDKDGWPIGEMEPTDLTVMTNHRPDRAFPMLDALTNPDFNGNGMRFDIVPNQDLKVVPLVAYDKRLFEKRGIEPAFKSEALEYRTISDLMETDGVVQGRFAESNKGEHVRYFWDGRRQFSIPEYHQKGITVKITPSENKPDEEKNPEMKYAYVAQDTVDFLDKNKEQNKVFALVNFATDIQGHVFNGDMDRAKKTVLATDEALGKIRDKVRELGGVLIVTADHGNVEQMFVLDEHGNFVEDKYGRIPSTQHSPDNPVPFIIEGLKDVDFIKPAKDEELGLANVGPTILDIMGIKPAEGMSPSLLKKFSRPDKPGPVVIVVRDGWGIDRFQTKDSIAGNPIAQNNPPDDRDLMEKDPWILLKAHGTAVGLPESQMGDSDNGHTTMGAGRIVPTQFENIMDQIKDGRFYKNQILRKNIQWAMDNGRDITITTGLLSEGGVHSHVLYVLGLLKLFAEMGVGHSRSIIKLHAELDGRDVMTRIKTQSGAFYLNKVLQEAQRLGLSDHFVIGSVNGRKYGMDRDAYNGERGAKGPTEQTKQIWRERFGKAYWAKFGLTVNMDKIVHASEDERARLLSEISVPQIFQLHKLLVLVGSDKDEYKAALQSVTRRLGGIILENKDGNGDKILSRMATDKLQLNYFYQQIKPADQGRKVEGFVFDLTGTLLTDGLDGAIKKMNEVFGIKKDDLRNWLSESDEAKRLRVGKMKPRNYWDYVLNLITSNIPENMRLTQKVKAFRRQNKLRQKKQLSRSWFWNLYKEIPGVPEILEKIRLSGPKIGIFTNMEKERAEYLQEERFPWLKLIKFKTSEDVGSTKPRVKSFDALDQYATEWGLNRDQIIYADDQVIGLIVPALKGYQTLLANPPEGRQLPEEVSYLLDRNAAMLSPQEKVTLSLKEKETLAMLDDNIWDETAIVKRQVKLDEGIERVKKQSQRNESLSWRAAQDLETIQQKSKSILDQMAYDSLMLEEALKVRKEISELHRKENLSAEQILTAIGGAFPFKHDFITESNLEAINNWKKGQMPLAELLDLIKVELQGFPSINPRKFVETIDLISAYNISLEDFLRAWKVFLASSAADPVKVQQFVPKIENILQKQEVKSHKEIATYLVNKMGLNAGVVIKIDLAMQAGGTMKAAGQVVTSVHPRNVGGIDLNAKNMQMDVNGQKINIHFDPAMVAQFKRGDFSGVRPVIIKITPIQNIMPLLGLKEEDERLVGV